MAFERITSNATITGKVRKQGAWHIISNFERYPQIMENVDRVNYLERNGSTGKSQWFVTVEEAPLSWIEKDYFDPENYEIHFESIQGDFDNINGKWKIESANDGIAVSFTIDYNLGIPVIEEVLGHILKDKMKKNMDSMINAVCEECLKKQVEERLYERFAIDRYNTVEINGKRCRVFIMNISQTGMLFTFGQGVEIQDIRICMNDLCIEARVLGYNRNNNEIRVEFKHPLSPEQLKHCIMYLNTNNQRRYERIPIEDVAISTMHQDYNDTVKIVNLSRSGMMLQYTNSLPHISNTVDLCGIVTTASVITSDQKRKTVGITFQEPLSKNLYLDVLERLSVVDQTAPA